MVELLRTVADHRNSEDEHDGAGDGAHAGVVAEDAGHDATDDATDVEQRRQVGALRRRKRSCTGHTTLRFGVAMATNVGRGLDSLEALM